MSSKAKLSPQISAQLAQLLAIADCAPARPTGKRSAEDKRIPPDEADWGAKVRRLVEVKRTLSELEAEKRTLESDAKAELERRGGVGAMLETLAGDLTLAPGGRNEPAREARYVSWVSLTWLPPGARAK